MTAKSKIVVTGANGQLGKELRDISQLFPQFDFYFLSREDLPIHHFELTRNYFKTLQPDFCINAAGYTAVDKAEQEKDLAFLVNGEAVGVLAAICKDHQTKLIHISTDYVFDGKKTSAYSEDDVPNPTSVYGASKLKGEEEVISLNADAIIIRTSWLYSSYGKNFVRTMMKLMKEKNEIAVVNDQKGSPTYAADLANACLQIISSGKWQPGIYHFCNEGDITWYDFALAIKEISGSSCNIKPLTTAEYPTLATRPSSSVLDTNKIHETFGMKLNDWKFSLQTCIKKMQDQ